jgi:hypothetical protein
MSNDAVSQLASDIGALVRGGKTIDAATFTVGQWGAPPDLVSRARIEFERAVGRITNIDDPGALIGNPDRTGWYDGPNTDDLFWPALKLRLDEDLDEDAVESVDKSSSKVVSLMHAPGSDFSTRGLVLGYVQSGKTTNFMSVIAKAADAGYKVFIVLSGITDSLRTQTQSRVDEVLVDPTLSSWYRLTTMDSDFSHGTDNATGLMNSDMKLIAVVKKNPARLRRLRKWLDAAGPLLLANAPIMIIDDEADQASIDVSRSARASRINGLIKQILDKPKAAYVGYTATPFANLLIDPEVSGGLYPRDFVVPLPKPTGYFGAEQIFGRTEKLDESEPDFDGIDVIRIVDDAEATDARPPRGVGAVYSWEPQIGDGLQRAVSWFVLGTAAKWARSSESSHSTMLVHTSMLSEAHVRLGKSIDDELIRLRGDTSDDLKTEYERIWDAETARVPAEEFGLDRVPFAQVWDLVEAVLSATKVVIDNFRSAQRLEYRKGTPTVAIVVGGNTLSRGLTLEGLLSSYFVRSASAYDTLLQMGRWFGYRRGYEDLVRIWITNELRTWFRDLSFVEAEIRKEIERYEFEKLTPLQAAVRIRTHPDMAITAAAKMRDSVIAEMSYSETRPQTILFKHQDDVWLRDNIAAVTAMVTSAQAAGLEEVDFASSKRGFEGVPVEIVSKFLTSYKFHRNSRILKSGLVSDYIAKEVGVGALTKWNVVFMEPSSGSGPERPLGLSSNVRLMQRSKINIGDADADWANLKAIASTIDRASDFPMSEMSAYRAATQQKPVSDASILAFRADVIGDVGLLCIYPIDKNSQPRDTARESDRLPLAAAEDLIGVSIFFPTARDDDSTIEYRTADMEVSDLESADDELADLDRADAEDGLALEVEG